MFDRIRKTFSKLAQPPAEAASSHAAAGPVSEWAATQGFGFSVDGDGHGIGLDTSGGMRLQVSEGAIDDETDHCDAESEPEPSEENRSNVGVATLMAYRTF